MRQTIKNILSILTVSSVFWPQITAFWRVFAIVCLCFPHLKAQTTDTLVGETQRFSGRFTVPIDSTETDSLPVEVRLSPDALDDKVDYSCRDSIIFDNASNLIYLYGSAEVTYKKLRLTANFITIDLKNNLALAEPLPDSSGKMAGLPQFKDETQEFTAKKMRYNFKTRKGMIFDVTSKQNDMFVHGGRSKFVAAEPSEDSLKAKNDVIYSSQAIFTTCSAEHPHFGIHSAKQKVIPNKMVIVGPSQIHIGDIPTPLALPFGFFPLTKGKKTGLIFPRDYQYSESWGFGLRNFGWYFPISDNYDLQLTGDAYVRGTFGIRASSRYVKNYKASGSFEVGFNSNIVDDANLNGKRENAWSVVWSHTQDQRANPNFRFNANVNFQASKSADLRSANYQSTVRNDFRSATTSQYSSSISFTKSFPGRPYSLSGSAQHAQNVATRVMTLQLPNLDFTMQTIFPFKRTQRVGNEKWFEKVSFQYASRLQNRVTTSDSLFGTRKMWDKVQFGVSHQASSNVNFTLFKYINLTPSINYNEFWYLKQLNYSFDPSQVVYRNDTFVNPINPLDTVFKQTLVQNGKVDTLYKNGFFRVNQFSIGASMSTRLFGTLNFKKGWLRGVRHTMTPSIGYNYSPSYRRYTDSVYLTGDAGFRTIYNKYQDAIFGAPSASGVQSALSYSLTNLFELKYFSRGDSTLKKMKLLENVVLSGNYNFAADSFRFSNVAMGTGTNFFKGLTTLSVSALFDPYGRNAEGRRIQTLALKQNGKLLFLDNLTLSLNSSISVGQIRDLLKGKTAADATQAAAARVNKKNTDNETFMDIFQNFRFTHNFSISRNREQGRDTVRFQNALYTSGDIPLSKKWRINVGNIGYDFINKKPTYPDFGFYRDLHCWEAGVNWQPTRGTFAVYLRVKPGTLDFLKIPYNKNYGDTFRRF